jgi:predicted RNase H-like HicB family nuclease
MTSRNATKFGSDPALAPGRQADAVIEELLRRGFRGGGGGTHVALERDGLRVVVPGPGRHLPARVVRMIEFGLEPHLGPRWLTDPEPAVSRPLGRRADVGTRTVHVLEAVVTRDREDEPWCAFLADDFSLVGSGDSRDGALRDLKRAAACWMEVAVDDVVLVTPTVI